nr:putative reverse transcriptase domain-containing protein [Tanacetum cinerariifolium]
MSDAAIKALVARSVADALAEHKANISRNGNDNHDSGSGERRQEFTLICGRMFPGESDRVEKYIGGLPDMIQGSVMASKPKTMKEAIEIANDLKTRRSIPLLKGNLKRRENSTTTQATTIHNNNLLRSKMCQGLILLDLVRRRTMLELFHCTTSESFTTMGHALIDCLELKNRNHGNLAGGAEAREMVYALGKGETDQDLNNMEDDINA